MPTFPLRPRQVRNKPVIPLRRLPRNFPVRGSFGEVGVMEFGQWNLQWSVGLSVVTRGWNANDVFDINVWWPCDGGQLPEKMWMVSRPISLYSPKPTVPFQPTCHITHTSAPTSTLYFLTKWYVDYIAIQNNFYSLTVTFPVYTSVAHHATECTVKIKKCIFFNLYAFTRLCIKVPVHKTAVLMLTRKFS